MDSIVLFVSGPSYTQVEDVIRPFGLLHDNVVREDLMFYFRRYPEWATEVEPEEAMLLVERLGEPVSCAFNVAVRHGDNARFALEVIADLMPKLDRALIDDDFGGLWSAADVNACLVASKEHHIYSLREWANHALNATGHKAGPRVS